MATIPGSPFRRALFWAHLCCGVLVGLLILTMSATGALLTYEKQIVAASERHNLVLVSATTESVRATADQLAMAARAHAPQGARLSLVLDRNPATPVTVSIGRDERLLLHPVTTAAVPDASIRVRGFFRVVEAWHRWLGGDPSSTRALAMDVANLLFLFIIVSGIYLWLPAVWRWRTLRGLVLFRTRYANSKARDFSWHHVMSVWMLVPLFLIALSGVVISYGWASNLVYAAYGEAAPPRRSGGGPAAGGKEDAAWSQVSAASVQRASYEQLLDMAKAQFSPWQRITLPLTAGGASIELSAELVSPAARPPRQTLTLDTRDASVIQLSPPPVAGASMQSPGQRARVWFRFIHTGEQYGIVGQSLAGLASLAACFLAYTGLALAWRRLVLPVLRTR